MSSEQLGRALDQMTAEAEHAQRDASAAAACLAGYRSSLKSQQAHLTRLLDQIDLVRDQVASLDRWADDGGRG